MESGYGDKQLITVEGICLVVRIYGAWINGHYVEEKDFTPEMRMSLLSHHADTLKTRIDNVGG